MKIYSITSAPDARSALLRSASNWHVRKIELNLNSCQVIVTSRASNTQYPIKAARTSSGGLIKFRSNGGTWPFAVDPLKLLFAFAAAH